MDWLANPDIWLSLATLTALEVVLGIDNLVMIAILAGKLPPERQSAARKVGLAVALITRLLLLFTLSWLAGLTTPLFSVFGHGVSWRDIVLILGGAFLIAKATHEIYALTELHETHTTTTRVHAAFTAVVIQIALLDLVFSFDSVITAVGMAQHIEVMVAAIVIAMAVMLLAADVTSRFIMRNPSVKMLALSFLILIGTMLVADGMGFHVPKGYLYFAMAFALLVEVLNMMVRRRKTRVAPPVPPPVG